MNLCVFSQALPYLPCKDGFRLYGANLLKVFSQRHRVDLISLLEDDDCEHTEWAHKHCATVELVEIGRQRFTKRVTNIVSSYARGRQLHARQAVEAILRRGLRSRQWDLLHVEGATAGGLIPTDLSIRKVLSLHDSPTLRSAEISNCAQSYSEKLYYKFLQLYEPRYERLVYPRYDAVTVVSDRDAVAVRKTVPHVNVVTMPSGTDTDYFRATEDQKQNATLVFHGHLSYPPNIEAALESANAILPKVRCEIPEAVLHLVGTKPVPRILALANRPEIRISADLPDLRAAVCSAAVYVCAIRHGTGMKNKLLEAMGMEMPIVSYPESTVGLEVEHGTHLMKAHSADEAATYIIELLRDRNRAKALGKAARRLVEERYSWQSRAYAYERLYASMMCSQHAMPSEPIAANGTCEHG